MSVTHENAPTQYAQIDGMFKSYLCYMALTPCRPEDGVPNARSIRWHSAPYAYSFPRQHGYLGSNLDQPFG
jgi:hypothetical protein